MFIIELFSKNSLRNSTGLLRLAVAITVATGTFALVGCGGGGSDSVNPFPSPSSSPSGTPSPNPSVSPSPSPSTNPSPSPSPDNGGVNGTLAQYLTGVQQGKTLTYRDVSTTTQPNPLTGQPTTNITTSEYAVGSGTNPFATEGTGKSETVTFESAQGAVTATRQENLDENNRVIGYTYFTLSSNAYTLYGQEILDEQGRVINRTLYSPAAQFSLSLRVGQSTSQTVHVIETVMDTESGSTTRREWDQNYTLTFNGIESVTVPAGTYTAAKVTWGFGFNSPAQEDTPASQVEATAVNWFDAGLGTVKSTLDNRTKAEFAGEDGEVSQTFEIRIQSDTQLLRVN